MLFYFGKLVWEIVHRSIRTWTCDDHRHYLISCPSVPTPNSSISSHRRREGGGEGGLRNSSSQKAPIGAPIVGRRRQRGVKFNGFLTFLWQENTEIYLLCTSYYKKIAKFWTFRQIPFRLFSACQLQFNQPGRGGSRSFPLPSSLLVADNSCNIHEVDTFQSDCVGPICPPPSFFSTQGHHFAVP